MAYWWYLIFIIINTSRAQSSFSGGGFLADPFLELNSEVTAPADQKSSKSNSSCVSNGALVGSIIATLLLSAFIGFLSWMIYLRQKLHELQSYENQQEKYKQALPQHHRTISSLSTNKQHLNDDKLDHKDNQLPLDATDYKFGTFPFRQSQTPSVNGHYNHTDWLNRIPSSFRSINIDKDAQMIDIELLNPTFCGLNFSITGNMRSGIFVKEILDKGTSEGQIKLNSSDQLRTGDRIIALTVCFESIVYEDALTILSYASPYPVILRIQRPLNSTKLNLITEKRALTINSTNKVRWRDDLEHYDNDNQSMTLTTDTKSIPSTTDHRSSSKKTHLNKPSSMTKGNKLNTIEETIKHSNIGIKIHRNKISTNLPINKNSTTPIKSVTNAVMSYLHYRGINGGHMTDGTNNSEATLMPYYDSPYDYYGAHISQSHLNKNNNNNNDSVPNNALSAVTSVYTLQLSSKKLNLSRGRSLITRRCERRLSSPAIISPLTINKIDDKDISLINTDTCT